jgi:hypothetical protein
MTSNLLLAAMLLAAATPPSLSAQRLTADRFPPPDTRLRITSTSASGSRVVVTGTLRRISGDSALVAEERGSQRSVSMADIIRLEVSRGRSHGAGVRRGLRYGPLAGLVTGAAIGAILGAEGKNEFGPAGRGEATLLGAGIGLVLGVPLGALVGGALGVERWERRWTSSVVPGA